MFTCPECKRVFGYKKNLYCHLRKSHGHKNPAPRKHKSNILCNFCGNKFQTNYSLKRHLRTNHKHVIVDSPSRIHSHIKCTECSWDEGRTYQMLKKHLLENHNKKVAVEELFFSSFKEFQAWKASYESENSISYVMKCAPKKMANNTVKRYYYCYQSHTYKSKGCNVKSMNHNRLHKIGVGCPSTMVLTIDGSGMHVVKLWPFNLGENDKSELTKTERKTITGKLTEVKELENVKTLVTEDESEKIQIILEDLHNMKKNFSMNNVNEFDENEAMSVDIWVSVMKAIANSPILHYKKQGSQVEGFSDKDFILIFMTEFQQEQLITYGTDKICVDCIYGLDSFDILLFTIFVDCSGVGVPSAFCVSNRADMILFTLFFKAIKNRVGQITTTTFMSDDTAAIYNAWSSVMGPTDKQLLCTWHIQSDWFQNLNKINNKEKKCLVFNTLKGLQSENEEEKVILGMPQFIQYLCDDEDTKVFGGYFANTYSNRTSYWANCYRTYIGANTNTCFESLHKKIQHTFIEQRRCKRLDKTINALLDLIRDVQFNVLNGISNEKLDSKLAIIRQNHEKGLKINNVSVTLLEENKWTITSKTDYVIEKITESCPSNCNVRCSECNICVHMFKCNCIDNIIRVNICKHIHRVAQNIGGTYEIIIDITDLLNTEVTLLSSDGGMSSQMYLEKNIIAYDEIRQKCELLLGLSSSVELLNSDSKSVLVNHLDEAIEILNTANEFESSDKVDSKDDIQRQPRLFSMKDKES